MVYLVGRTVINHDRVLEATHDGSFSLGSHHEYFVFVTSSHLMDMIAKFNLVNVTPGDFLVFSGSRVQIQALVNSLDGDRAERALANFMRGRFPEIFTLAVKG